MIPPKPLIYFVRLISFPFWLASLIFEMLDNWGDRQLQKIEDKRIDKIYMAKYGKTYKEYNSE